jgi:hypothetical protein
MPNCCKSIACAEFAESLSKMSNFLDLNKNLMKKFTERAIIGLTTSKGGATHG